MKAFYKTAIGISLAIAPFAAFAVNDLTDVFRRLGGVIGTLTPVVVAIALLAFFWGLAMYVLNFQGKDEDKKKGRDMMVYGVIVLFVMVSVWGLVNVLQNTFFQGTVDTRQDHVPCVNIPGGQPCI